MKRAALSTLFVFLVLFSFSQLKISVSWNFDGEIAAKDLDGNNISVLKTRTSLQKLSIKAPLNAGEKLAVVVAGVTQTYTKTDNSLQELDFGKNIIGQEIVVKHLDNSAAAAEIVADTKKFKIINDLDPVAVVPPPSGATVCISCKINDFIVQYKNALEDKPFGLYDGSTNTVHLFFDYFGNSLLSTVPQGISNAHYQIHIVYPFYISDPDPISYSVKQKTGSFNSSLNFNNASIRTDLANSIILKQAGKDPDGITERIFSLGIATDDLSFDIVSSSIATKKVVLESYTIKMSPVYHGSFDVGLLKTNLANPAFNLVTAPNNSDLVVKETDGSSKGVATIMASFYTSPIILLENLIGKKKNVPLYKLTGRSFLDDHKFYERIYPTIGVSISSKSFENIFYGFNFELARGLNVFGGWNYGKVNVFKMPGYIEGTTIVNQQQFDFYKNTEWKTSTAFGIKVDALIIKTLFGSGL
jgi:hypothetical protein